MNLSGIELGFGGVWLCSSPNLCFSVRFNATSRPPGKPEVKLDGWNMNDTKHNIFNSLGLGTGRLALRLQRHSGERPVGSPGTPNKDRVDIDCGVWRYHPTRKVFEAVCHGTTNPFGLDWDEYGEMFITNCVIDHLFHFVPGGALRAHVRPGSEPLRLRPDEDASTTSTGPAATGRRLTRGGKPEHSDAGGGHAHAGCMIYLGDNFPTEYRNTLFTATSTATA